MCQQLLLLCLLVWVCLGRYTLGQTFTENEKNQLLRRHRQVLEQESFRILEAQLKSSDNRDRFQKAINYEGFYENLKIVGVESKMLRCSEHLPHLTGFDYKRHDSQHYLLCFSSDAFLVKSFEVQNSEILLHSEVQINQLKGIKQAILFRQYDQNKLFVAVLYWQNSLFAIKTFEVNKGKLEERMHQHTFQYLEQVVRIDVLHYDQHMHQLVALLQGNQLTVQQDKQIVKLTMPGARFLQTMRVQTRGYLLAGNHSHWCAYSYKSNGPQLLALYQSSSAIVDLKARVTSTRHYLIVANEKTQMVFHLDGETFKATARMAQKQTYRINLLTLSYSREDFFFYFDQHNKNDSFSVYSYDVNQRIFYQMQLLSKKASKHPLNVSFDVTYGGHFSERDTAFELKLSNSFIYVFAYKTTIQLTGKEKIRNIVGEQNGQEQMRVVRKMGNIKHMLTTLESVETISKRSVNVTFPFAVQFKVLLADTFESRDTKQQPPMRVLAKTVRQDKLFVPLEVLYRKLSNVRHFDQKLEHELNTEVVYKSAPANITGLKEFMHSVFCPQIEASTTQVDFYQNKYVNQVLSGLYRHSTNLPLNGTKSLLGTTVVDTFLHVNRLNQVPPEHFLYARAEQEVESNLWYKRVHTNALLIGEQLAPNISLAKAVFINQNANEPIRIQNRILFTDLSIDNFQVDKIDNLWLHSFASQVLRKDEHRTQTFKVPTHMDVMNAHCAVHTEMLNQLRADLLFSNLIFNSGKTKIQRPVIVNGNAHFQVLNVHGAMNGIRVPEDLLDKHSSQTVKGHKKFSHVSMENFKSNYLNDIRIPEDTIQLSSDEPIIGHFYLDALHLDSNLLVNGLLDQVNMTHLDQRYISSLKNNYHNLTFNKPVHAEHIRVGGSSNGLYIEDIFHDSVLNHSHRVHVTGAKSISSMLKCGSIEATSVNGHDLSHFVTTNNAAFLPQKIIFKKQAQFSDVTLDGTFDGVSVKQLLENVESLESNRVIYGKKDFKDTLQVDQLTVHGSINGIYPAKFMHYNDEQIVTGNKWFKNAQINRLHGESSLVLHSSLNKRNFSQMLGSMLWLDRPQVVGAVLYCTNCSATRIDTTYVNSRNFTYFNENYLSKSKAQTVRGNKNFKGNQAFFEVKTRQGIAGMNMSRINEEAITLHGHNLVRNHIVMHTDLHLKNGQLTAKDFNNIDINEFYRNVVHNNRSRVEIHGKTFYKKGFDLHSHLQVTRLNHKTPEQLLLTTNGNHVVHSNFYIAGRVITSGDVRLNAKLNDIDLVQLDRSLLKVNDRGELDGSVNLMNHVRVNELVVLGLVDGMPLHRNSVLMKNSQQNMDQMVLNGPVEFEQNLNVWQSINGYHQDNLNKIVLIKSTQTQLIKASKTFASIKAVELEQSRGEVHIGVLNGVNMAYFRENVIYSGRNQSIKASQHFHHNVTLAARQVAVLGKVNHLDLTADVIRLDQNKQTITGLKTFSRVQFESDLDVHGHVNGFNLSGVRDNILYTEGHQIFPKALIFHAPIYLMNESTVERINNFEPSSLLTLDGNHQVNGQLQFSELQAKRIDSEYVNAVNLTHVSHNVLYLKSDRPQVVAGAVSVNEAEFDGNVNLKYHLNGLDLNVAVESANSKLNQNFDIVEVTKTIQNHTNELYQQRSGYEFANFEIEYLQPSSMQAPAHAIEEALFHAKLKQTAPDVLMQLSQLHKPDMFYQPFIYQGYSCVAIIHANKEGVFLEIAQLQFGFRLVTIHSKQYTSGTRLLVFVIGESIHVLSGANNESISSQTGCKDANKTRSSLEIIPSLGTSSSIWDSVQQFDEHNVLNLGHFLDDSDYHHIVFNSYQTGIERQIRIYKRYSSCRNGRYELFQTISAQNVEKIALFHFGIFGLNEQYLLTLDNRHLTLWKQQGISGFSRNWSVRTTVNRTFTPFELRPLILNSRLFLFAPTCPTKSFEAHANGQFYNLQLIYDDFI